MYILKPYIFNNYPEILFGFSTKISSDSKSLYYFNLSYSVGDEKNLVDKNRKEFFEAIGLTIETVGYQRQIHSDIVQSIECGGDNGASDALITSKKNLGLAIAVADCTPKDNFLFMIKKTGLFLQFILDGRELRIPFY